MVLSTHAAAGAAIAALLTRDPGTAFAIGFASHFALDAIPHWHYRLLSFQRNPERAMESYFVYDRRFFLDVLRTGFDFSIGLAAAYLGARIFAPGLTPVALAGAAGGAAPDLLQLAYYRFRHSPLRHLQRFHHWAHATGRLDDQPLLGVGIQAIIIVIAVFAFRFLPGTH